MGNSSSRAREASQEREVLSDNDDSTQVASEDNDASSAHVVSQDNNDPVQVPSYSVLTKELLHIASGTLPLRTIKSLMPFASSLMIARISDAARAAATIINAIEDFSSVVFNSTTFYLATAIGNQKGDKKPENIGRETQIGWITAAIFSLPQMLILYYIRSILNLFNLNDQTKEISENFFQTYFIGVAALSIQSATDQLALTTEHVRSPVLTQLGGLGVFLFLGLGLGYGWMGLPNLGVEGIAWGLVGRALFNFLSYSTYLTLASFNSWFDFDSYNLFKLGKDYSPAFKKQLINAIMFTVAFAALNGGAYFLNMLVGKFGDDALSAQLVISNWLQFALIPATALGHAGQICISEKMKNIPFSVWRYGNIALCLSLLLPAIYLVLVAAKPDSLISPFVNLNDDSNANVLDILIHEKLLLINGVNMITNTVQMALAQLLVGMDKVPITLLNTIVTNWLSMGLAYKFAEDVVELNLFSGLGSLLGAAVLFSYWTIQNYMVRREAMERSASGALLGDVTSSGSAAIDGFVNDHEPRISRLSVLSTLFPLPSCNNSEDLNDQQCCRLSFRK